MKGLDTYCLNMISSILYVSYFQYANKITIKLTAPALAIHTVYFK